MSNPFKNLEEAIAARSLEWDSSLTKSPLFRAVELGGEAGELLNEVKKLVREAEGLKGSTSSKQKLADEIGDVLITLIRVSQCYNIDPLVSAIGKFNRTSVAMNLKTLITRES